MPDRETFKEHKKRIETVIDYILKNINNNISLQKLAEVASYSPFHLQKLFKRITGESPKQYVLKLRLETTLLLMIIHPNRSVKEISIDTGFSSPSAFSRAVKSHFGIPPEEIRKYSPAERMGLFKMKKPKAISQTEIKHENEVQKLDIRIKKIEAMTGIYLIAPCDDPAEIQKSFKEIMQTSVANDLSFDFRRIYGMLCPHQGNIYKTFVAINKDQQVSGKFNVMEIKAGKYVTFKVSGDMKETIRAGHFLYHKWLPQNGYKIADVSRFEAFSENPATTPYNELQREVYMAIEPM